MCDVTPHDVPLVQDNKFHRGAKDGKHYWLTPPDLLASLTAEFGFTFDACPYPLPAGFDGLTCDWGDSTYVNPPFGSIIHEGRKKGPTAWARKALDEASKGKRVVMVYPIDKWVLMMIAAGAEIRNLGDVKWHATEDGMPGKGTGRHIACFILNPPPTATTPHDVTPHDVTPMTPDRLTSLKEIWLPRRPWSSEGSAVYAICELIREVERRTTAKSAILKAHGIAESER